MKKYFNIKVVETEDFKLGGFEGFKSCCSGILCSVKTTRIFTLNALRSKALRLKQLWAAGGITTFKSRIPAAGALAWYKLSLIHI